MKKCYVRPGLWYWLLQLDCWAKAKAGRVIRMELSRRKQVAMPDSGGDGYQ